MAVKRLALRVVQKIAFAVDQLAVFHPGTWAHRELAIEGVDFQGTHLQDVGNCIRVESTENSSRRWSR